MMWYHIEVNAMSHRIVPRNRISERKPDERIVSRESREPVQIQNGVVARNICVLRE